MNDVIIIGGGIIGMAVAIELKLQGVSVTVLQQKNVAKASYAAAGMLAAHAEKITSSDLFDLCKSSLELYANWISSLENITGKSTGYKNDGILAPVYQIPSEPSIGGIWLESEQLREYQTNLDPNIVGAWFYPNDGQVDNRSLINILDQVAQSLDVKIEDDVTVTELVYQLDKIKHLNTTRGIKEAGTYILANGAHAAKLLPIPVRPVKGQMLSLNMLHSSVAIKKVIFGDGIYLVPRMDGRLIVGATVEEVGWQNFNTPIGMKNLLDKAIALYPPLRDYPVLELWWGFRPGTPDEGPLLGSYENISNLFLGVGHYRNGILLAPITAKLLSDMIVDQKSHHFLTQFSAQRFMKLS